MCLEESEANVENVDTLVLHNVLHMYYVNNDR